MRKHLKKIALISIPIIILISLVPILAHSQGFWEVLNPINWIKWAIMAVLYLISYIGTLFFSLAGYLVGFFLKFNYGILNSNNLIDRGWAITRDIANLGFVLVIVIIALATILRFQEYGYKKLLPKLIAAAILVNFSLAIAGVFIDFSHVLTKQFFSAVESPGTDIVQVLSGAFEPQKFYTEPLDPAPIDPEEEAGGFEGFTVSVLLDISKLLFTAIFIFAAAFVLFAFAFMLLLRYIYLSLLLVIAPIAWLFWVFPALSGQFKKWWSKFLEWVFFAPVVAFFFYLTLTSIKSLNQNALLPDGTFFKGTLSDLMAQGAKMVLLIGLLFGGLIIAQQMGITGAAGAMKMANTVGNKTKKWAGEKMKAGGIAAGRRALTTGAGKDLEGKSALERAGEGVGGKLAEWGSTKWGRRFGIGVLSKPFTGIAGASAQAKEKLKAETEARAKKRMPESSELALARMRLELSKPEALADSASTVASFTKIAQDKKMWGSLTPQEQEKMRDRAISAGRKTNSLDKVIDADKALLDRPEILPDEKLLKASLDAQKSPDFENLPDDIKQAIYEGIARTVLKLPDNLTDIAPNIIKLLENKDAREIIRQRGLEDALYSKIEASNATGAVNRNLRIQAAALDPSRFFESLGFDAPSISNDEKDESMKEILSRVKDPANLIINDLSALSQNQRAIQTRLVQNLSFNLHSKIGSEGSPELKTNTIHTLARGIDQLTGTNTFADLKKFSGDIKEFEEQYEALRREKGANDSSTLAKAAQFNQAKTDLKTAETNLKNISKDAHQLWQVYQKDLKDTNYQDATWP
ncbi:MAG: hypothetical protein QMD65_00315 [Patescibacteria group bacterium]|nr:hypothetical protein [Patescibacteria group bacterium]